MAKDPDAAYQSGKRTMLKVKHRRTAPYELQRIFGAG
jgi:ATP-dependent DNA ligase